MGTEMIPTQENEEKPSELEQKIIRQIEYYFGNYNLNRDKFLKEEIKKEDGWVALETMVRFQRLKQLTEDYPTISSALKKSPNQLMEVNEDCTKIRRRVPVENINRDEVDNRTLYVKGFKKDSTLDQILDFFKNDKVENVQMRKRKLGDRLLFKGSVFATFTTKEDSEAYFEKKGMKIGNTDMIKERKKEYIKRKDEFFDNLRAEKEEKAKKNEKPTPKGCLLKITGLGGASDEGEEDADKTKSTLKREDIKAVLEKFGKVAYIDFYIGQAEGVVRFEEGIVSDILSKLEEEDGERKLEIGSVKATVTLIEGEEETKYWEKIKSRSNSRPHKGNQKFGNKGRFNKKNKNQWQKGKKRNGKANDDGSENADEPPTKKIKAEVNENADEPPTKKIKAEANVDEPPTKKVKTEANDNKSDTAASVEVKTE